MTRFILLFVIISAFACNATESKVAPDSSKATMYYNGDIVTMSGDSASYVEAVVVKDGKILSQLAGTALLNVMDSIIKKYGKKEQKVVMIHCSLVQEDQIVKMKELCIMPSFYPTTLSEAAESFQIQIGDRVNRMHPAALAVKHGLVYTIHNDAPLIPLEVMPLVWAATNRKSKVSGKIFGPEYALTPYQALLALTRNAAFQLGEDKSKGSIVAGKRADPVVLDKNPLKVDKDAIKDILVVKTLKDGKVVFEKATSTAKLKTPSYRLNLADDPCEKLHKGQHITLANK